MAAVDLIPKFREKLAAQASAQNLRLIDDVAALIRDAEAKGTLKSPETLMQSTLLCCQVLQDRLDLFLDTLKDLIKRAGGEKAEIGPADLKEMVGEFFQPNDPVFKDQIESIATTVGAPGVVDRLMTKVERARAHSLTRLGVEIDILCRRLKTKKAMFWQNTSFAKGVMVMEIICSLTTVWFAYLWIHNPTTTVSVQMIMAGALVYLLGRFRRHIEASY